MTTILGITGGIACGKSTVVQYFIDRNVPVIDADIIAREVVAVGQEGLAALIEQFGVEILQVDGSLNRTYLGSLVFADEHKRAQMNACLGPIIRKRLLAAIEHAKKEPSSLVIVDIPLLYESHYESYMTKVLVVYVSQHIQLERLMKRNQLSVSEAMDRITSQWPLEEKCKRADIVLNNEGTIAQIYAKLDTIYASFVK